MTAQAPDARKVRSRNALLSAFDRLFLRRQQTGVTEILAESGLARSTFYAHFRNAEQLRDEALMRPLTAFADAIEGGAPPEHLALWLDHFRDHGAQTRRVLEGASGRRASRLLQRLIQDRTGADDILAAMLAAAALGVTSAWLRGEAQGSALSVAHSICRLRSPG